MEQFVVLTLATMRSDQREPQPLIAEELLRQPPHTLGRDAPQFLQHLVQIDDVVQQDFLPTQPRGDAARVLQAKRRASTRILPRARQFCLTHWLVAHARKL